MSRISIQAGAHVASRWSLLIHCAIPRKHVCFFHSFWSISICVGALFVYWLTMVRYHIAPFPNQKTWRIWKTAVYLAAAVHNRPLLVYCIRSRSNTAVARDIKLPAKAHSFVFKLIVTAVIAIQPTTKKLLSLSLSLSFIHQKESTEQYSFSFVLSWSRCGRCVHSYSSIAQ